MNNIQKPINYSKLIKDLKDIIAQGAANIERVYKAQVIKTNWEVGRYLTETLPLDQSPSANNKKMIGRLAKEFGRTDNYFYELIKFYRIYPELPSNAGLSWSHYAVLLKIDDPQARQKYQILAVEKNISAKLLYGQIANDKVQDKDTRAQPAEPLQDIRGRLYHYQVAAPKDAESNTGTATLDLGFKIFRDIPLSKKSKLHAGHMVRVTRSDESKEIFCAKIANAHKAYLYTYVAIVERVVDGDSVPRKAAYEMRDGPSESTCRSRLQSALSGNGQNLLS